MEPTLKSVLHRQAKPFVALVDSLSLESLTTRYSFVDNEEYAELLTRDVSEGMRIYWTEMLSRAHIAAVTAILRSRHWMSAVLSSYSERGASFHFAHTGTHSPQKIQSPCRQSHE